MKLLTVVLLLLFCSPATWSQSRPIVEDKGNFGLHIVDDGIRKAPN